MTDSQNLLTEYVRSGSEAAFRELVTRYVDLVYSTALRLVEGDAHRAQDVAQTVFADLARMARTLSSDVMLGGWLHRHTCFVAANMMRGERRRQSRERQAVEMNALQDHADANLSLVAPILDQAINELGEADRAAILLRFFEQRDFRSVGEALGSNEDAARMRVTRALEKLETLLKRHGVTSTATALSLLLSANAVQAAPLGLAVTISAATAAGTTLAVTATATATKAIAMTTLQKTIIGAALAAAIGTGIYEARQASQLRKQNQTFQRQQAPLAAQLQQLQRERDDATIKLASLREDNDRLNRNTAELLKLRGEVTRLKGYAQTSKQEVASAISLNAAAKSWLKRVDQLKQYVEQHPKEGMPEFQFLNDLNWLSVANAGLETDTFEKEDDYDRAMQSLRFGAETQFAYRVQDVLRKFSAANNGQFPSELSQLQTYCESIVGEMLLQLYEIKPATVLSPWLVKENNIKTDWVITRVKRVTPNTTSRLAIFADGHAYWQSPP